MWTRVPDRADGDVFTAAMWNTYLADNFNQGVAVVLADEVITSSPPATTLDLDNIDQTFSHLELFVTYRSDLGAGNVGTSIRFNGDSGANYDEQYMDGNNTTVGAGNNFGQTAFSIPLITASSGAATLFSGARLWIPDYTDTAKDRCFFGTSVSKIGTAAGNMFIRSGGGYWRSNAAITSISIIPQGGGADWVVGTHVTLVAYP